MSRVNGVLVSEVEEIYPSVPATGVAGVGPGGANIDETPTVTSALANILGWRPRTEDPAAFQSALRAAFRRSLHEGVYDVDYVPRSFTMQAEVGSLTGGQASLWARARAIQAPSVIILDSLRPLSTAPDLENCEALRTMVRDGLSRLVDELGTVGGPRVARVDLQLGVLTGWTPGTDPATLTADTVDGLLGQLRDAFGLTPDNSFTPEDEAVLSDAGTLVDSIVDIAGPWGRLRDSFTVSRSGAGGFMGTQLVWIDRLLAASDEQLSVVEDRLDSVGVPAPVRQTLQLREGGMTVDALFSWAHVFFRTDAKAMLDGGRIGIETSFAPMVWKLHELFAADLVPAPPEIEGQQILLPLRRRLPGGFETGRVRIAVADLLRLMRQLSALAAQIHVVPRFLLLEPIVTAVDGKPTQVEIAVELGSIGDPDRLALELGVAGGTHIKPIAGSQRIDGSAMVARFETEKLNRPTPRAQARLRLTAKAGSPPRSTVLTEVPLPYDVGR